MPLWIVASASPLPHSTKKNETTMIDAKIEMSAVFTLRFAVFNMTGITTLVF